MTLELTTESTLSHYGIPVARINGIDRGPKDICEEIVGSPTAALIVCSNLQMVDLAGAEKFCSQDPSGVQPGHGVVDLLDEMFGASAQKSWKAV